MFKKIINDTNTITTTKRIKATLNLHIEQIK